MAKDYGTLLTRYLDATGTNYDTVVYQRGKPPLDSEFVFDQELQNTARQDLIRQSIPSGWMTGDFDLDSNEDFDFRAEADTFYLVNRPIVNVNGWTFPVEYTDSSVAGENKIELPLAPLGIGNTATDFVYLEVWRALVAPNPSTENKPAANKVYRHGNVLSLAGEWLDDDLIDTVTPPPIQGNESTKRVQIQYRLKSRRLTNKDKRLGYDDDPSGIAAQGPNSILVGFFYQQSPEDPGLWVAGDGDPDNACNTVDGYIYSIPLCLVFRRNRSGFDYLANGNGGNLLVDGRSDRPDGFHADNIVLEDILDLRHKVSLVGHDYTEYLQKNVSRLMDQSLKSWATNTAHTGWQLGENNHVGTRYLMADDLLPDSIPDAKSGNNLPRAFDGYARRISDRAHSEHHIEVYSTGPNWVVGDTFSLDISGIPEMPAGTVISDVVSVSIDVSDGVGGTGYQPLECSVTGLGTQSVTATLEVMTWASDRDIWVVFEISYPKGMGLNAYVDEAAPGYHIMVHAPSEFNALIGTAFANDATGRELIRDYVWAEFDQGPHREAGVYYTTFAAESLSLYSLDTTTVVLPEFLHEDAMGTTKGVVSVTIGATPYTVDSTTAGRVVNLADPLPSAGSLVTVNYFPKRPLPPTNSVITLYYMTPGIQAVNYEYLLTGNPNESLELEPLVVSPCMFVGTRGSGSQGASYPYDAPLNQIPVSIDAVYDGEEDLAASGPISITGLDLTSGLMALTTMLPMVPVSSLTLQNPTEVDTENAEYIHHYTSVDTNAYQPSAIAQSLSTEVAHKCFVPVLAKLKETTPFGIKGEVVLVVFSEYLPESAENRIGFSAINNTTCAAIYRLKGAPLLLP